MADLDLLPSKILALLIRPDFWLWLGLLTALWASWRGWRTLATWVLLSLVATVTLVGFVPVGQVWLAPLEQRFATDPAIPNAPSAIVVLGGGEDVRTSAAWNAQNINAAGDRLVHALRRAQQFPQTPVLFTGGAFDPLGDPRLQQGPQQVERLLLAAGLEPERVHISGTARNTAEHPQDVRAMLSNLEITPSQNAPLLLITSAFHMPRAIGVFCVAELTPLIADPTDHRTTPGARWRDRIRWAYSDNLDALQLGMREWAALVGYNNGLLIPELFPGPCDG